MLASYLPMVGAADLYYKSDFVLAEKRWHWCLICWLIENVPIITIIMSPFLSGLLLFLTSLGITKVKVNVSDNSFLIIISAVVATLAAICFSFSLTIFKISSNTPMINRGYTCTCNMMGHCHFKEWYIIHYYLVSPYADLRAVGYKIGLKISLVYETSHKRYAVYV